MIAAVQRRGGIGEDFVVADVVAGDAVNILSNSWNDANSTLAIGGRVAGSTTINAAVIAGNVPTSGGGYSGGIENFVRFHEDWSGKYFTIYGAMAQLFASEQAASPWSGASSRAFPPTKP